MKRKRKINKNKCLSWNQHAKNLSKINKMFIDEIYSEDERKGFLAMALGAVGKKKALALYRMRYHTKVPADLQNIKPSPPSENVMEWMESLLCQMKEDKKILLNFFLEEYI